MASLPFTFPVARRFKEGVVDCVFKGAEAVVGGCVKIRDDDANGGGDGNDGGPLAFVGRDL